MYNSYPMITYDYIVALAPLDLIDRVEKWVLTHKLGCRDDCPPEADMWRWVLPKCRDDDWSSCHQTGSSSSATSASTITSKMSRRRKRRPHILLYFQINAQDGATSYSKICYTKCLFFTDGHNISKKRFLIFCLC